MSVETEPTTDGNAVPAPEVPDQSAQEASKLAAAHSSYKRSRAGFSVMVLFLATSSGLYFYTIWIYEVILKLAAQHGWGTVPPEVMPFDPAEFESRIVQITNWSIAFTMLGFIAFLYGMGTMRSMLVHLLGRNALKFGWGWTVASIFIPIWSLYRPWAGFGEIRRAVSGMSRRGIADLSWQEDGISAPTVVLGVVFMVCSAASNVFASQAERALGSDPGAAELADFVDLLEISGATTAIVFATIIIYGLTLLFTSRGLLKRLSLRRVVDQF